MHPGELCAAFDAAHRGLWEPHPEPTTFSIRVIEKTLSVALPQQLIDLARSSTKYSDVFLSIGPDFESPDHIIPYNDMRHRDEGRRQLPKNLAIFTNGFMEEDYFCLEAGRGADGHALGSVWFWSPPPVGYDDEVTCECMYGSFEKYLEAHLTWRTRDA